MLDCHKFTAIAHKKKENHMGIIIAYTILALLFLALSSGFYQPKKWRELTDKHVRILKIGCFLGFLLIVANLAARLL